MLVRLAVLILSAATFTGDPQVPPGTPGKPRVEAPLRSREDVRITAAALDGSRTLKPRFECVDAHDKIEQVKRSTLSIWSRNDVVLSIQSDLSMLQARDTRRWVFECATDAQGVTTVQASLIVDSDENVLGVASKRAGSDFAIIYSVGNKPTTVQCAEWVVREADEYSKYNCTLRANVKPETILDLADAGVFRVKYPEKSTDFELTDADREVLRWFVEQKVPGGAKMVEARYELVPRADAAPKPAKAP